MYIVIHMFIYVNKTSVLQKKKKIIKMLKKSLIIIQIINTLFMNNTYQIYLISDSTGETLDRIFLAIKAQFKNFNIRSTIILFTRTENQITKNIRFSKRKKKFYNFIYYC